MGPNKRIVVGCDGTWLNSDSNFRKDSYAPWSDDDGRLITPSNVTRICRALQPRSIQTAEKDGSTTSTVQVVDYHPGIGSSNNWWDHFVNGATATSVGDNVNQGYASISEKYEIGDEIFLFGFSRGSFVARSIAAMIADLGLLTKKGMEYFYNIFQDWENQNIPGWKQRRYSDKSMKDMNDGEYCSYARQLEADGLTRLDIRIKAVCCFDTVGSLGVPTLGWRKTTRTYAFVNTEPPWNVDHCFHALALDEVRLPFTPTLWELPASRIPGESSKNPCDLRQCWFPGQHSNIGGSVEDAELPDISLAWMVEQLASMLDFDPEYLHFCRSLNLEYYKRQGFQPRKWAMGYMANSKTGIQVLGGSLTRIPGCFTRTNPENGRLLEHRLENTNEKVHPSVRIRLYNKLHGKAIDDKGPYNPASLKGFKLKRKDGSFTETEALDPTVTGFYWELEKSGSEPGVILTEEELGQAEKMLLEVEGLAPTK